MHGTKKYVKTTFLPGAAAFSYEGWLSCIAFEEVCKNTLTCDWIIPCRSMFQRTADAPSQSWRPWRRSWGWGSRTRSRAASVSAGPAGQTCPRSREGAFSTVDTLIVFILLPGTLGCSRCQFCPQRSLFHSPVFVCTRLSKGSNVSLTFKAWSRV